MAMFRNFALRNIKAASFAQVDLMLRSHGGFPWRIMP
jgi:hypothetical protein